jgi:hypothetical protein
MKQGPLHVIKEHPQRKHKNEPNRGVSKTAQEFLFSHLGGSLNVPSTRIAASNPAPPAD